MMMNELRENKVKTNKSSGFTLIELMILVAILGIISILIICGVSQFFYLPPTH
jgi:prepilin-type N-terminal cleavage/methylation domain-containing protein